MGCPLTHSTDALPSRRPRQCRDTAYDQYGQLVVRLTKLDVVELYEGRHGTEGAYVSPPHKDYTA